MKKLACIFAAAFISLSLLFCLPAQAEEIADPPASDSVEETPDSTPETPAELPESGDITADDQTTSPSPEASEEAEATFSELLAEWLSEYAAEILSAASVIVGGVIAVLFKKGFLPFVAKALSGIAESSKALADKSEAGMLESSLKVEEMRENCAKMADEIKALEQKLTASTDTNAEVLRCTTEMIGTLLLNLKLSVDQRAIVENAMAAVKAKTGGDCK